ncbi:Retrotransposon-derived protein PEG10 [Rhizoctonia solani]|uniref:Retrotransposon-derived protein PEG10 n=1 Tax=Rhizoctonia solani TaxID=456999 RepID=A0A8H8SWP4_9AGAM|nr:Retrotransposon-derived protein PEG10 [Rhizoctonia solani]QRW20754.1 Retrotransposon-derived protein PEG10 [Rhizoctonia solani]
MSPSALKSAHVATSTYDNIMTRQLLSTKDNIPEELEVIFAAAIKIDNTHCKNKENHPKKQSAKSLATMATSTSPIIPLLTTHDYTCYPPNLGLGQHATTCTGHVTVSRTSTTTTRVQLLEDPNYVTLEERDYWQANRLCVKCGQKGHGIKQCPNGWKATIKESAKVGQDKLEKE